MEGTCIQVAALYSFIVSNDVVVDIDVYHGTITDAHYGGRRFLLGGELFGCLYLVPIWWRGTTPAVGKAFGKAASYSLCGEGNIEAHFDGGDNIDERKVI